jgi:hypothetical protein
MERDRERERGRNKMHKQRGQMRSVLVGERARHMVIHCFISFYHAE